MHPRSRHWHLLDYVLVRRRDQKNVLVTKRSRVTTGELTIASSSPIGGSTHSHTGDLKSDDPQQRAYSATSQPSSRRRRQRRRGRLSLEPVLTTEVKKIQSTALAVLGRPRLQHQDWFDDTDAVIRNPLVEKNRLNSLRQPPF
ncbi:hypothetical protein SprV_0802477300 [Sparganum proliferum]